MGLPQAGLYSSNILVPEQLAPADREVAIPVIPQKILQDAAARPQGCGGLVHRLVDRRGHFSFSRSSVSGAGVVISFPQRKAVPVAASSKLVANSSMNAYRCAIWSHRHSKS